MRIANLNYLEYIPEMEAVSGGVGIGLAANVGGDESSVFASIDITSIGDGGIGKGLIKAISSGSNALALTDASGSGDKVVTASVSAEVLLEEFAFSASVVVAIDYPL